VGKKKVEGILQRLESDTERLVEFRKLNALTEYESNMELWGSAVCNNLHACEGAQSTLKSAHHSTNNVNTPTSNVTTQSLAMLMERRFMDDTLPILLRETVSPHPALTPVGSFIMLSESKKKAVLTSAASLLSFTESWGKLCTNCPGAFLMPPTPDVDIFERAVVSRSEALDVSEALPRGTGIEVYYREAVIKPGSVVLFYPALTSGVSLDLNFTGEPMDKLLLNRHFVRTAEIGVVRHFFVRSGKPFVMYSPLDHYVPFSRGEELDYFKPRDVSDSVRTAPVPYMFGPLYGLQYYDEPLPTKLDPPVIFQNTPEEERERFAMEYAKDPTKKILVSTYVI
jgi:hypothetical protein